MKTLREAAVWALVGLGLTYLLVDAVLGPLG